MAGIPAGMESDDYSDEEDFILENYSKKDVKVWDGGSYPREDNDILRNESFGDISSHSSQLKKPQTKESFSNLANGLHGVAEESGHQPNSELLSHASCFSILSQKKSEIISRDEVSLDVENVRMAIIRGNTNYVKEALEAGFDANTTMKSGWSPLMYAASGAFPDIIELLVNAGADPKFENDLFTPLMALCTSSKTKEDDLIASADELVIAGCDLNRHDRHRMTPIMYASRNGRARLVEFLAARNATINAQDVRGWTALAFAADKGHAHVAKALLKKGADPKLNSFDGQSPADLAYASGFLSLCEMLEGNNEDVLSKLEADIMPASESQRTSPLKKAPKYIQYGNLEVFLSGLSLTHLIPLFHDHQISFPMLLKMDNEDLIEMGLDQFGVRKKLLEAIRKVHKTEWDLSSLEKAKLDKLSTMEAASIVANVSNHLIHIQSSVEHVERYIDFAKDQIRKSDQSVQRALCEQCATASENAFSLANSLKKLEANAVKSFPIAALKPADSVHLLSEDRSKWQTGRVLLGVVVVCVVGVGVASGAKYISKS